GWTTPVNLSPLGFAPVDVERCLSSHGLGVLGQTVLLTVYMLVQKRVILVASTLASVPLLEWLRPRTFLLVLVCATLSIWTRRAVGAQVEAGKSMSFEISSYLSLFPMVLISAGILLVLLWKAGGLHHGVHKLISAAMLATVARLSFDSSSRFRFLGWFVAASVI